MKEFILPGYSIKNKDWAYSVKDSLPDHNFEVVEWSHWAQGEFSVNNEALQILKKIGDESYVLIAKSVGTLVAMHILKQKKGSLVKLVLCGIPLHDLDENDKKAYQVLTEFSSENVLVVQNTNDNHGSYQELTNFLSIINPKIKALSRVRDDHEYPYSEEITEFLRK